jgi:release factor glutamine methyltransferase
MRGGNMAYRPMMTRAEAEKRKAWQQRVWSRHAGAGEVEMELLGLRLVIPPDVFATPPWEDNLLSQSVAREVRRDDRVLDVGTGCGVQGLVAAMKAREVMAIDLNPSAVKCARANARRNGLSAKMTVIESDLFGQVEGKFDLVIFDPPFRWMTPRNNWEAACADAGYRTMTRFFGEVGDHLAPGGRMILHFGTSGDIVYFHSQIRKNGFRRKQLLKASRQGWDYMTYRVTRPSGN